MYFVQHRKHLQFNTWADITSPNGFEYLKDAAIRYYQERGFQPFTVDLRVVARNNHTDKEVSRHKLLEFRK